MNPSDLKEYLLIFDIDGTLLHTHGDGKKAFTTALNEVFQSSREYTINFLGGVDFPIFYQFFEEHRIDPPKLTEYWNRFKTIYHEELQLLTGNPWQIYPEVYRTIQELSRVTNLALATGNLRSTTFVKLSKFGLDRFFDTGGYGDDVTSRTLLVEEAILSSEEHYGRTFQKDRIFLFGDTQKDVQSALDNGIIPVLIDHQKSLTDEAGDWGAHYYGDFKNIIPVSSEYTVNSLPVEFINQLQTGNR